METVVPRGFGRFIGPTPLAIIIVGLVMSGSVMSPAGSSLPGAHTNATARVAESHSGSPMLREAARPDPIGVAAADDREFFTQLAWFLTCSRGWWAILARLLGNGDTPLTTLVAAVDACDPGSGLEAFKTVLGF
jgi:hypothetical protein